LGLAVTPRAITAVEVVASRGGPRIAHAAEMPFADPAGLKDPAALGKALREFLRGLGVSARRCVIGLDACWLATREKRLPPAASASLADILRIAAEQEFASEGQDLIVDYVPGPPAGGPCALLAAAPRPVVEQLALAAGEAGLAVAAVSSSALALAAATAAKPGASRRFLLSLAPQTAELVATEGDAPRLLRRLSPPRIADAEGADAAWRQRYLAELEAELRRMLASSQTQTNAGAAELLVWNAAGLEEDLLREMGERLGAPLRLCRLATDLGQLGAAPSGTCTHPAPAAALAIALAAGEPLPLDFLHSRLALRKKRRFGRVALGGSLAAVALIGAITWLVLDWQKSLAEIASMNNSLHVQKPRVAEANNLIAKIGFARKWYDRRPMFMECLRELAVTFPDRDIWATSLDIGEDVHAALPGKPAGDSGVVNLRVVLSGKAANDQIVINLQKRLLADPRLAEVKLASINGGAGSREVSFVINFTFVGAG
jgi:hypothetical protein